MNTLDIHESEELLTLSAASKILNCHPNTLRNWDNNGVLEAVRINVRGDRRYRKKDILKLVGKNSELKQEELFLPSGIPKVISMFSGIGGLDLGFEKAGFRTVWANDNFLAAAETYKRNVGPIDTRPIEEVPIEDLPNGDVLLAGFPCQPFSNAGSRKGISDPRGTLFFETLRFIDSHKPKVVVFENVRGLLSITNPDGSKLIDGIVRELEDRNYVVNYKLLSASDYNVPQNRYRVFIVGVLKTHSKKKFKFPEPIEKKELTLRYVLKNLPKHDPNDEYWELSPQSNSIIEFIPEGGSWKNVPYEKLPDRLKRIRDDMKKYHSPNFYRRFSRDEICGTITAAATPENSGILHPLENRRYTVREIARIQSFSDDFIVMGKSKALKYKQIGNAVPPNLAYAVASSIMNQYF